MGEADVVRLLEETNDLLIWVISFTGLIFLVLLASLYALVAGYTELKKQVDDKVAKWEPALEQMKDEVLDLKREMVAHLETFEGVALRADGVLAKVDADWDEYEPKVRRATDEIVAILETTRSQLAEIQERVGPTVRQLSGVASAVRDGLAIFRSVQEKTRKRP